MVSKEFNRFVYTNGWFSFRCCRFAFLLLRYICVFWLLNAFLPNFMRAPIELRTSRDSLTHIVNIVTDIYTWLVLFYLFFLYLSLFIFHWEINYSTSWLVSGLMIFVICPLTLSFMLSCIVRIHSFFSRSFVCVFLSYFDNLTQSFSKRCIVIRLSAQC